MLRGSSSSAPSRSRSISPRCGRSHGTPPNCSACVISCSATQRSSWSAGASSAAAACARFGATNSSRAGLSGSSTGNSYWPSTRPARKPETAPASIAITPPATTRSGPTAPAIRVVAGSSTVSSEARLASIQPERPTASATGTGVVALRPV